MKKQKKKGQKKKKGKKNNGLQNKRTRTTRRTTQVSARRRPPRQGRPPRKELPPRTGLPPRKGRTDLAGTSLMDFRASASIGDGQSRRVHTTTAGRRRPPPSPPHRPPARIHTSDQRKSGRRQRPAGSPSRIPRGMDSRPPGRKPPAREPGPDDSQAQLIRLAQRHAMRVQAQAMTDRHRPLLQVVATRRAGNLLLLRMRLLHDDTQGDASHHRPWAHRQRVRSRLPSSGGSMPGAAGAAASAIPVGKGSGVSDQIEKDQAPKGPCANSG